MITDNKLVPRTCRRIDLEEQVSHPIEFYNNLSAYVLLADPGMGKSTLFEQEAQKEGNHYIKHPANFIAGIDSPNPNKILFIDGLDEVRTDFDELRKKLKQMGTPRFRIACRAADWFGASDFEDLKMVSPNQQLAILELTPLNDHNIKVMLKSEGVNDPDQFCRQACKYEVFDLLRNPQILILMIKSLGTDSEKWPSSRKEIYEKACLKIVQEHNAKHIRAKSGDDQQLILAAGHLCAIQLISGLVGFAKHNLAESLQYYNVQALPEKPSLPLEQALKTKLFHTDDQERFTPIHRSVAEYLAAHYLAYLIEDKTLSFDRIKAQLIDSRGFIAYGLRGLASWLAIESVESQNDLLNLDPAAILSYGGKDLLPQARQKLLLVLKDLKDGKITTQNDELLGLLLDTLYPEVITPNEILDYLHSKLELGSFSGAYSRFWYEKFLNTENTYLPGLLDSLVQKHAELSSEKTDFTIKAIIGKLLLKGLIEYGKTIADERLYQWLGLGVSEHGQTWFHNEEAHAIAAWFIENPQRYQAMIRYGASLCVKQEKLGLCMWDCQTRLQGASPPKIALWFIQQAKQEVAQHKQLAQYYLAQAASKLRQGNVLPDQELDLLNQAVNQAPDLLDALRGLTWLDLNDQQMKQSYEMQESWRLQDEEEKRKRVKEFRQYLTPMREGTAPFMVLYNLGQAYQGRFSNIRGTTPEERIKDLLGGNIELVEAAKIALSTVLQRKDLPSVKEIFTLAAKEGKYPAVRPACLVNIGELYETDESKILSLDDTVLEKALAFYFTDDLGEKSPPWVELLLKERSNLCKNVLRDYGLAMIRSQKEHITPLYRLITDNLYSQFAPELIPEFLKKFPPRISEQMLNNVLEPLLKGTLKYVDKTTVLRIVENRLSNTSIDAPQRVYWLGLAFILNPDLYQEPLRKHVASSQKYLELLSGFIQSNWQKNFYGNLSENAIGFLIELLVPLCSPERPLGFYQVSPAIEMTDLVYAMIQELRNNPNRRTNELKRLLKIKNLENWHLALKEALLYKQDEPTEGVYRSPPSVDKICKTLANKEPSNPADLSALTLTVLEQLANEVRYDHSNPYRSYWNGEKPRLENECRDTLLYPLKKELKRFKVEVLKEGSYADDTRADIRVSFNGEMNIPIEIKRSSDPNLWEAMREQLMKKYATGTDTGGYGIYIVFWFGKPRSSPEGYKLKTAIELQQSLQNMLRTNEEKERIKILVIDCSRQNSQV